MIIPQKEKKALHALGVLPAYVEQKCEEMSAEGYEDTDLTARRLNCMDMRVGEWVQLQMTFMVICGEWHMIGASVCE